MAASRIILTFVAAIACTGCSQMSLKSPVEMFHDTQLGNYQLLKKEYGGSEHAREWHLREQALQQPASVDQSAAGATL